MGAAVTTQILISELEDISGDPDIEPLIIAVGVGKVGTKEAKFVPAFLISIVYLPVRMCLAIIGLGLGRKVSTPYDT